MQLGIVQSSKNNGFRQHPLDEQSSGEHGRLTARFAGASNPIFVPAFPEQSPFLGGGRGGESREGKRRQF